MGIHILYSIRCILTIIVNVIAIILVAGKLWKVDPMYDYIIEATWFSPGQVLIIYNTNQP